MCETCFFVYKLHSSSFVDFAAFESCWWRLLTCRSNFILVQTMTIIASQTFPIMEFSWERFFRSHWTVLIWERYPRYRLIVQTWFHPSLKITKISWFILFISKMAEETPSVISDSSLTALKDKLYFNSQNFVVESSQSSKTEL